MNFESNLFQIIFAVIAVTIIAISYHAFQPQTQNGDPATSTDSIVATSCNKYQSNVSKFRPNYLPAFDNRQALKQAFISYHGEDMKGKDGPMAAVGFDVVLVYHEYQSHKCNNSDTEEFEPKSLTDAGLSSVSQDGIRLDSIATNGGAELTRDMKELGATEISRYKHIVSATVPIEKIPQFAKLSSLRSASIPRTTTNSADGAITN